MEKHEAIKNQLQEIFRKTFKNSAIEISDTTAAKDINGWDSIAHLELVVNVEKTLKVQFSTAELSRMKNVGDFIRLIEKKQNG